MRFLLWGKCMCMTLAAVLVTVMISGLIYQYVATKIDDYRFPPIGQMVDVGGYRLHMYRTGTEKGPTVVLEAGLGGSCQHWALVQPEIAKFANVLSYDRAGYGWSDSGPDPRTSQQMVAELHELLTRSNMSKPYILVGHSLGGLNVRLYTSTYPDDVAGVVLVDSLHEDQSEKMPKTLQPKMRKYTAMTFFGISRLFFNSINNSFIHLCLPQTMSPKNQKSLLAQAVKYKQIKVLVAEAEQMPDDCKQIGLAENKLTDKLLTVIMAGKDFDASVFPKEYDMEKHKRVWKELQQDLVKKSKNGKQMIAENSGHMIPFEQPEIIVRAVRDMIDQLNKKVN